MILETVQLWLAPETDAAAFADRLQSKLAAAAPDLLGSHLSANAPGSFGGGDFTLDLGWRELPDAGLLDDVAGLARSHRIAYRRAHTGSREFPIRDGIWRTAVFAVHPGKDPTICQHDVLAMPDHIAGIRQWSLGWSLGYQEAPQGVRYLVWQQAFQRAEDLLGEYLMHPCHWGWVDRHFDPDHPDHCADLVYHCFGAMELSLLPPPDAASVQAFANDLRSLQP